MKTPKIAISKFGPLLRKFKRDFDSENYVYTLPLTIENYCKEFEEFITKTPIDNPTLPYKGQISISPTELKLLTTYRHEFIAWLKLQQ